MTQIHTIMLPALRAAFPLTVPIMAGFLFLGITAGIFCTSLGLGWWAAPLMSVVVFAGSAEFTVASMLTGVFNPLQVFLVVLVINARHLFYGLTMIDAFRSAGRKRPYLIYALCDETFSIICSTRAPRGVDENWFMFFVSLLNQSYWVAGCTLGGIFGSAAAISLRGISFAMTALFVVIFVDRWMHEEQHMSAVAGIALSAVALLLFGADRFIIPSMLGILVTVTLLRGHLDTPESDDAEGNAS